MSRSAADATRFTATSPHAYAKSPTRSSPSNPTIPTSRWGPPRNPNNANSSKPTVETPKQKVARLRAARLAAREGQISTWDRIVVGGRIWADRAYRITVYGLMGATVLAGGVTAFALSDMIIHNRRKRNEYYAEQTALLQSKLSAAIAAERSGQPLDDEQVLLLNRERAKLEAEDRNKKKKEERSWSKWLFKGLRAEEVRIEEGDRVGEGLLSAVEGNAEEVFREGKENASRIVRDVEEKTSSVLQALEDKRREGEKPIQEARIQGGPLDQLAEEAKVKGGRSWTGWTVRKD